MPKKLTVKSEKEELSLFNSRAIFAGLFVFVILLALSFRLAYLQIAKYDFYTKKSKENYHKNVPIPPIRGLIYDRNGILLASNQLEYVVEVIRDEADDIDNSLIKLAQLLTLSAQQIKKFKQKLRTTSRYAPTVLKSNLTEKERSTFYANQFRFPGFKINIRSERVYPFGNVASHLLGYVGRVDKKDLQRVDKTEYVATTHIGKAGIEKFYESRLHGKSGNKIVEVDAHGRQQITLEENSPVAGEDLFLSVDLELQVKAEELLEEHNGAVVALDPRNGEILAMASMPNYDPNLFVNGISYANYNALRNNPDNPLYNRALQGTYPPGSTIKPMIALGGLNSGAVTRNSSINAKGFFQVPGNKRRYRCWHKPGHGHTNMNRAIYQSCDVYFYDLAFRMGIARMSKSLKRFGFGTKTGIDLPHERAGILPTPEWKRKRFDRFWYPGDTVNAGIGQGYFTATPLQLAQATAMVAMKGHSYKPHALRAIRIARNLKEELVTAQKNETIGVKSLQFWTDVQTAMFNVVHGAEGTARHVGFDSPYKFSGKTGTAQVFGISQDKTYDATKLNKKLHDHSLFVAYAPAKNPRIALAVIAENAGGGSKVAAPIARQLLDTYLLTEEQKKRKQEAILAANEKKKSLEETN